MPIVYNQQVIAGTVDGATITHDQALQNHTGYSIDVAFTGAGITGLVKLMASNDGTAYTDVPNSEVAITAADSFYYDVSDANYKYVRLHCESTSGAITFSATLTIKKTAKLL
jgi:hypothetical protein